VASTPVAAGFPVEAGEATAVPAGRTVPGEAAAPGEPADCDAAVIWRVGAGGIVPQRGQPVEAAGIGAEQRGQLLGAGSVIDGNAPLDRRRAAGGLPKF
jgi:hypothetical protein